MKRVMISRLGRRISQVLNRQEGLCDYWAKCQRTCGRDKDCGTKRFYDKYPDYEFLGIGAMTVVPGRQYANN